MTSRQMLLPIYRSLRPVVDTLRLNALARPVWAALWRGAERPLIQARQNNHTWWLDPDVALGGEAYETETVAWLRRMIKPGMTVVDIGANVGQLTLEMAHLVGPSGRVVSIEPSPGNIRLLKAHVAANGFASRVTIIEAACCAEDCGELILEVRGGDLNSIENGPQLSGLGLEQNPLDREQPRAQIKVRARSFDSLAAELELKVALMKVDVEGAEAEVFKGARETLRRFQPGIIFGFHPFAFKDAKAAQGDLENIFAAAGLVVDNNTPSASWTLSEYTVGRA